MIQAASDIISEDNKISVFVNSSNYIEKLSFTIKIMGIEEVVEIIIKNIIILEI